MKFDQLTRKGVTSTGTRYVLSDSTRPGFSLKVSATGQSAFYYRRKELGKRIETPLGTDFERALSTYLLLHGHRAQRVAQRAAPDRPSNALFLDPSYDLPYLVDAYLQAAERTLAAATIRNYRIFLEVLLDALEGSPTYWGHGTPEECRRAVKELLKQKRDSGAGIMCNRMRSCYSSLFKWSVDEDICSDNPIYNMPGVPERPKDTYLESHEVSLFLRTLRESDYEASTSAALYLILLTGMRPGEVLGLWPNMVDLGAARLILPETKNGRKHLVALSQQAVDLLRPYVETTGPTRRIFKAGPWGLRQVCIRACKRAGVTRVSPHDLRRTFATLCGQLGVDELLIGKLLNHAPAGVTARHYALYSYEDEKREACQRVADHINPG